LANRSSSGPRTRALRPPRFRGARPAPNRRDRVNCTLGCATISSPAANHLAVTLGSCFGDGKPRCPNVVDHAQPRPHVQQRIIVWVMGDALSGPPLTRRWPFAAVPAMLMSGLSACCNSVVPTVLPPDRSAVAARALIQDTTASAALPRESRAGRRR
jgi:hypothetical protein